MARGSPPAGLRLDLDWSEVDYPAPVARLIDELRKLPGIGPKSAQRIAFHLLRGTKEDAARLSEAVATLLEGIRTCALCNAITDQETCAICANPARTDRQVCVVEGPHDLVAVEKTRDYRGRYHVLHGALDPLQGVGPDELRIQGLLDRVRQRGALAAEATVPMKATKGRASFLGERSIGHMDPGARSSSLMIAAICTVLEE